MCGIAGIIRSTGGDAAMLHRMLDALVHRGPDDEGRYIDGEALIGQRRLSIIDLEGGHQPIANEDGSLWIVCNGEIYNYRSLRDHLIEKGHHFRTASDSEVILHLYEERGERCVDHLRGMFAFAIWDAPRRRLFAARDHLGQKPFYYASFRGGMLFASEIKALLAADGSLARLDPVGLDHYLALRLIPSPLSMFEGIRKLPPAHVLTYSPGGEPRIDRYWKPEYLPKLRIDDREAVERMEEAVLESLRLHMQSDVPVGAFLSGGLDSGLVVAMLRHHGLAGELDTFSIGLPYGEFNEAPAARVLAERYGTRHHESIHVPSLARNLTAMLWHCDEPSDSLAVCAWDVSEEARRHVKVALGGDGGDELFGGYDRYYGVSYAQYLALLPAGLRKAVIGPLLRHLPDGRWYKSISHQIKWLYELSFLEGGRRYARALSYAYFRPGMREKLYGPRMRQAMQGEDAEALIIEAWAAAGSDEPLDRMLYADACIRLPDHPVMLSDRMGMAHSLETRSPFMDHRLVELGARLPARLKVRGRKLRWLQYRLAERYLPEVYLKRPKQGFASALPYLLRDEYRMLFDLFLRDSSLAAGGYLRQEELDRLRGEHQRGTADHGNRLWQLLSSEVWYRLYVEGVSREQIDERIAEGLETIGRRDGGIVSSWKGVAA